jgi:hypothetical protein
VALSISRFLLFANVAHGIQAEPHSLVTNPHVRIGQITILPCRQRLGQGFTGIHLDEERPMRGSGISESFERIVGDSYKGMSELARQVPRKSSSTP